MRNKLSAKQMKILEFIKNEVEHKGYPPSVREIGSFVGLASSSTVHGHLSRLEKMGYIRRDPTKPRAIEILDEEYRSNLSGIYQVPMIGKVTAGLPITAIENIEEYIPIPKYFADNKDLFMLKVQGDSMVEAGIFDNDFILVHQQDYADNGEIIVALTDEDEATVKRFYKEKNRIRLQPENSSMEPIYLTNVRILGKVIGVFRKFN